MSHFNERLSFPVKSAFHSNITGWSSQNLSKTQNLGKTQTGSLPGAKCR